MLKTAPPSTISGWSTLSVDFEMWPSVYEVLGTSVAATRSGVGSRRRAPAEKPARETLLMAGVATLPARAARMTDLENILKLYVVFQGLTRNS